MPILLTCSHSPQTASSGITTGVGRFSSHPVIPPFCPLPLPLCSPLEGGYMARSPSNLGARLAGLGSQRRCYAAPSPPVFPSAGFSGVAVVSHLVTPSRCLLEELPREGGEWGAGCGYLLVFLFPSHTFFRGRADQLPTTERCGSCVSRGICFHGCRIVLSTQTCTCITLPPRAPLVQ